MLRIATCRIPSCARLARGIAADRDVEVWATEIKVLSKERAIEVVFNTGDRFRIPAELLRAESPSAAAQTGPAGRPRVVAGRRHVGVMAAEPVGNYAVRLQFDDMHGSGLYTWGQLHELGTHKWRHMKDYILRLRAAGLSRDPPARRRRAPDPPPGPATSKE